MNDIFDTEDDFFELTKPSDESFDEFFKVLKELKIELPNGPAAYFRAVTPAQAKVFLTRNNLNRKLNRPRVSTYANDIKNGEFPVTNQGIGFDTEFELFDGQTRLNAVVSAGKPAPMLLVFNLPTVSRNYVDIGQARSPGQIMDLRMQQEIRERLGPSFRDSEEFKTLRADEKAKISRAIRTVLDATNHKPSHIPHTTTKRVYEQFERGVTWAATAKFHKGQGMGKVAFRGALAATYHTDPTKVEDFALKVTQGENISKGEPAYALREYFLNLGSAKPEPAEVGFKTLIALQAHIQNKTLSKLMYTKEKRNEVVKFFNLPLYTGNE